MYICVCMCVCLTTTNPSGGHQSGVSLYKYSRHEGQLQGNHMQGGTCCVASDERIGQPAAHGPAAQQIKQELEEYTHTHTFTNAHKHRLWFSNLHDMSCCARTKQYSLLKYVNMFDMCACMCHQTFKCVKSHDIVVSEE